MCISTFFLYVNVIDHQSDAQKKPALWALLVLKIYNTRYVHYKFSGNKYRNVKPRSQKLQPSALVYHSIFIVLDVKQDWIYHQQSLIASASCVRKETIPTLHLGRRWRWRSLKISRFGHCVVIFSLVGYVEK